MGISRNDFIYELDIEECVAILNQYDKDNKLQWLQTKYICYSIFQSQSTKHINFKDFMKLPWNDDEKSETTILSDEEKDNLIKISQDIENKLNNNG